MDAFLGDELVASLLLVHGLHPDALGDAGRARARLGAALPRSARRRRRAARHRRSRGRGASAIARQLRRVPVIGGHAAARRRRGHRRGRTRDRHHRRRAAADRQRVGSDRTRPQARVRVVPVASLGRQARLTTSDGRARASSPTIHWPCSVASGRRAPHRSRARGSAASCAASPLPTSTVMWSTSRPARSCAPVAGATCSSRRRGPAGATTGPCPTAT